MKPQKFRLGKTVFRRNQLTSDLFSRIQFGEKMGTGFKRMKDICKAERTPFPDVEYTDIHFYITFKQSRKYLKMAEVEKRVGEKVGEKVTENQRKILELTNKNPHISAREISKVIGISQRKTEENISKLKQKGLLKRIGPDKGGYWKAL